jgi:hypothetical protein
VEVPPGDAVLRGDNAGAGSQQRSDEVTGGGVAVRLQAEKHDVDRSDLRGIGRRVGMGLEVAARAEHGDTVAPHGLEVLAAGEQVHVGAAPVQCRADVSADRSGADDRDLH